MCGGKQLIPHAVNTYVTSSRPAPVPPNSPKPSPPCVGFSPTAAHLHVRDLILLPVEPLHLVLLQLQPCLHVLIVVTLQGDAPARRAASASIGVPAPVWGCGVAGHWAPTVRPCSVEGGGTEKAPPDLEPEGFPTGRLLSARRSGAPDQTPTVATKTPAARGQPWVPRPCRQHKAHGCMGPLLIPPPPKGRGPRS